MKNKQETIFLVLVGVLAGVVIYTKAFDVSHQLIPAVYSSQFIPAEITFRSDVLVNKQQLELSSFSGVPTQPQVEVRFVDVTNPAPIEEFTALNTHVGNEVALFWEKPEGVSAVNIYRKEKKSDEVYSTEELIAEAVQENSFIDTSVTNGIEYYYTALSVNVAQEDGTTKTYTAQSAAVAQAIPVDDIPPRAPSNVQVTPVESPDGKHLHISWEIPEANDFAYVIIYRSENFGSRGEPIIEIEKNAVPEYIDSDAQSNVTYYYTVVAYDDAGNGSSTNFSAPNPGNENPFSSSTNSQ